MIKKPFEFQTAGGITVKRTSVPADYDHAISAYLDLLDSRRGAVFSSNYEYPGRYTRWDTAIVDPPLVIESVQRLVKITALNERGQCILPWIAATLDSHPHITDLHTQKSCLKLNVIAAGKISCEEERSRLPTVFSVIRTISTLFHSPVDDNIGLYGAFGYDLVFQFDQIDYKLPRPKHQRDLVLYLPDEILVVDHHNAIAWRNCYDFSMQGCSTQELERSGTTVAFLPGTQDLPRSDHAPGEYATLVEKTKESFKRGDLFEVVPGQTFYECCRTKPSVISRKLKISNPSPYSFFINLGEGEYLVGASPEMFVRICGRRIETCPISGTIRRGGDAISDSEQIIKLLNSEKDESELTMCSDVDRNDKSRVCEPGSVRVIARRQIELYSKLIHTVDHIEGCLRKDRDAFDGFLSHAWAVTVTGAPKLWAMRYIEEHEKSPRAWYGGAVGMMYFNGDMNTGLTLRTIHIRDGVAQVRAGATLLFDSDGEEEEAETELKASAMLAAIRDSGKPNHTSSGSEAARVGEGIKILLVDHEDSFVHTLANYFRQTGAEVTTLRFPISSDDFDTHLPGLVVLSPGPGCPEDFDCAATIQLAQKKKVPIFGVCLGLQAITEAYGGRLAQLDFPMHGKPSKIHIDDSRIIFSGLPRDMTIGRYHSIYADPEFLPNTLQVTATSEDGIIMALEHKTEPVAGVQFHPESIMSLRDNGGMRMIENVVAHLAKR